MCGRYTLRRIDLLSLGLRGQPDPGFEEFTERPRFNIAPTQQVPIVRLDNSGERVIRSARWGLIPFWTRGKPKAQPINARDDKLLTSPMFKGAMQRQRCLVPADGFYEWKGAKPPKVPHFFRRADDTMFAFAGLWERWRPDDEEADPVDTCLQITTSPNDLVAPVHDRMPAILQPDDYSKWLDPDVSATEAAKLLRPYPADAMEAYVVSTQVNKVENDQPILVERAATPSSLFPSALDEQRF